MGHLQLYHSSGFKGGSDLFVMELGLDFDDDDFEERDKSSSGQRPVSYNAKICAPLWFKDAEVSDSETAASVYKYRGDYYYYQKQYELAVTFYKQSLENLPASNRCMTHDITESLARCYLVMDKHAEALQITNNLLNSSTNSDQTTQALLLLHQIQCKTKDSEEERTLQKLISLHPFNIEFWLMLKSCYWNKFIDSFPWKLDSDAHYKIFTCLMRAWLLIRSVRTSVGSFIKDRHQTLIKQVEEDIEILNPSETVRTCAKKHLGEDIFKLDQEDSKEVQTSEESEPQNFDERWFRWKYCSDIKIK